jgi:acyl-CoA thioesterase II
VKIARYPYRASARWEGQVVAESAGCLCLEEPGAPSTLYFPLSDVALHRFEEQGLRREPVETRVWSIGSADGHEILSSPVAPPDLVGFACFDQDRIRIEVSDGREGDAECDVTVKRFPLWGDAADLIDVLDVRPEGPSSFVGVARSDGLRPVVEGSQMLGQAIVAAGRYAPDRRVVSATMMFLRPADACDPLRLDLTQLSAGRTFTGLGVHVSQGPRCCASGTVLLGVPAQEVIRHDVEPPAVPGPYECVPYDMGVTGRDIRVADDAYSDEPDAPVGPSVIDAWVRFRDVPDDPALNAGLLAQFSGHMSIAAALRPHDGVSQAQAHRTLSMGINAISLSVHREVRADAWMLYHHVSTFAGDGMTHSECRVHDLIGNLLASFTVEAMVRPFPAGTGTVDDRTAL